MNLGRRRLPLVLLLLGCCGPACALAAPQRAEVPAAVEVGVWYEDINSIDLVDGSFAAEFFLWWISPDPEFKPFDLLQVVNGREWSTRTVNQRRLADGNYQTSGYVTVRVNHDWDMARYPFDHHRLDVVLETPLTAEELRIVPNRAASAVSSFLRVEGFDYLGMDLEEHVEKYPTDFGIRDAAGNKFSRLTITVKVARQGRRIIVVTLIGFIVANLFALLTFAIHVSMLSIRASMVSSAIFGAVGNTYLLNSWLHPAAGAHFIDRIAIGSFTIILVALITGVIVDRIYLHQDVTRARIVNWTVFAVVFPIAVVYYVFAFLAVVD